MAKKTNCVINGKEYYRIYRKVGMKVGKYGIWVDDRKAFYGSCKSEAERKYQDYIKRKKAGIITDRCAGDVINEWIEAVFKSSDLANATKVKYIGAYKKIFEPSKVAGLPMDTITALDLQALYNSADDCYSTVRALHNLLRRFFKYAEYNGFCQRDITSSITVPKKPKKPDSSGFNSIDVWKDDDLKKVIESLTGTTLRLLVVLAANTGARFSELLALTYDDIKDDMLYINKQLSEIKPLDSKDSTLHIDTTKTATSNRVIPLPKVIMQEVKTHKLIHERQMLKNGYRTNNIFTTSTGTYYYRRNIIRSLKRLYARIGVPYHKFHAYRHTFGTNLSRAGIPIEETAKLMGHSDISMTAKYYVDINAQRKLEAVERITAFSL